MSNIDCVIFDLDGTLIDGTEGILSSVKYLIKKHNLEDISDEELLSFISDYKINLLEPKSIMDFTKFRTQLKQLFEVLQNASDKNRLQAVLQEDEQFKNMDRETVEAINLFAGMNIQTDGKEEVIDMCKAWEEQ